MIRYTLWLSILVAVACAPTRPLSVQPSFPLFREYPVSQEELLKAASTGLRSPDLHFTLDLARSGSGTLMTHPRILGKKGLKQLAYRGKGRLRGIVLDAQVQIHIRIAPSYRRQGYSRATIELEYRVHISRLGDRRQWIQWISNGKLEEEVFEEIERNLSVSTALVLPCIRRRW